MGTCLDTYHRIEEKVMLNAAQMVYRCAGDFGDDWLGMRRTEFPGQGPHSYARPHKNFEADVHPHTISNQHGSTDVNPDSNRYPPSHSHPHSHRYAHATNQHPYGANQHA